MQIYVESLYKYNDGKSNGRWVDLDDDMINDVDDLDKIFSEIMGDDEESLISDTDGFLGIVMSYWTPEMVMWLRDMVKEHGDAFLAYFVHIADADYQYANSDDFEDKLRGGPYDDEMEYVDQYISEMCEQIPEGTTRDWFECHTDRDIVFADLDCEYSFVRGDEGIYVFSR